jgi:predicted nucleic acid-binding protein
MPGFVLDCSVAISWIISDESSPTSLHTLELVAEQGAIVPALWTLEVGNVLLNAERNKRISLDQCHSAIYTLNELPIQIDTLTSDHALKETFLLAKTLSLTLYDASYLELAIRYGLPIATFDTQLKLAAKQKKVEILV